MGINGDKRNGVFSGFIPQNPEIRGRGRGYTSLEVRGGDGDGGKQNFWGFLGEKPRKSSIFGAGTGDTISGILPTLVSRYPIQIQITHTIHWFCYVCMKLMLLTVRAPIKVDLD